MFDVYLQRIYTKITLFLLSVWEVCFAADARKGPALSWLELGILRFEAMYKSGGEIHQNNNQSLQWYLPWYYHL